MSLPVNNHSSIRRSARQSVPTRRAKEYFELCDSERPLFPSSKDEIVVKWLLQDRFLWWPATVASIESKRNRSQVFGRITVSQVGKIFSWASLCHLLRFGIKVPFCENYWLRRGKLILDVCWWIFYIRWQEQWANSTQTKHQWFICRPQKFIFTYHSHSRFVIT